MIHPRKFAAGERAAPIAVPDSRLFLRRAGWRRLQRSSAGEFDVQMLLALNDARRPAESAAGWDGGRFELWRRTSPGCRAPCVRADLAWLRLRWDTAADQAEAEIALGEAFEKGLGARLTGAGRWASRGGAIALQRGDRETTIVFAPDRRLAAETLGAG